MQPTEDIRPRRQRFRALTWRSLVADARNLLLGRTTPRRVYHSYQPTTDGLRLTVIRGARMEGDDDATAY